MAPSKSTLLAALIAGVLTSGGLYFVQQNRAQEAARLRHANDRIRYQANLRSQPELPTAIRAATTTPEPIPPSDPAPLPPSTSDYRNEGQSTPKATLQTFAWACARGDTAAVEQLLWFEDTAREKAQAFMATLPIAARNTWASPEAMAATLLTADAVEHPFPTATILEKATPAVITGQRILLELPGTGPLREHTEYQKFGDSWKYVVTKSMVETYVRNASARAKP